VTRSGANALPRHVAIIMDGNGRWAEQRGLPRLEGHRRGARAVDLAVTTARELGLEILTLFAFSSENWGRPEAEVQGLMELLSTYLQQERRRLVDNGIRLQPLGEIDRLPARVRDLLDAVVAESADNRDMTLNIALSYGGREEIVRAARTLAQEVAAGRLAPEAIDPEGFAARLFTAGQPDPDLVIRTSGELRVSNFMLWQIAYSELYVTRTYWPDFTRRHFRRALAAYGRRERRYGLTRDQLGGDG